MRPTMRLRHVSSGFGQAGDYPGCVTGTWLNSKQRNENQEQARDGALRESRTHADGLWFHQAEELIPGANGPYRLTLSFRARHVGPVRGGERSCALQFHTRRTIPGKDQVVSNSHHGVDTWQAGNFKY